MIRYLRRNGVPAEPLTVGLDGKNTGEALFWGLRKRRVEAIYEDLTIPVATRNVMLGTELDGYRSVADPPSPWRHLTHKGLPSSPMVAPTF